MLISAFARTRRAGDNRAMVAVSHAAPEAGAPQTVAAWLDTLRGVYPDDDLDAFEAALAYARERCGATRGRDGEPLDRPRASARRRSSPA